MEEPQLEHPIISSRRGPVGLRRGSEVLSQRQGSANAHNEAALALQRCTPLRSTPTPPPPSPAQRPGPKTGCWNAGPRAASSAPGTSLTIAHRPLRPPPRPFVPPPPSLPLWLRPCRPGPPTHLPGTAEPSTLRDLAACFRWGRWVRHGTGEVRGTTSSLSSVPATNSPAAVRASGGSHTANDRAARGGGCQPRWTHTHTQRESEGTKLGQ